MNNGHRFKGAALAALLLSLTAAAPAAAHEGDPHYRSEVRTIAPSLDGLSVRVLDHDDALEVTNRSGKTVVIGGYNGEPYARVLADGTVQVDEHSATYATIEATEAAEAAEEAGHDHADHAHDDATTSQSATGGTSTSQAPDWVTLDKTGRYAWHDARIKWRKTPVAPQVTDRSKETKVFDWQVPLHVGTQAGTIQGTLFWVGDGSSSGGFPVAAAVSLVVLGLLAGGGVALVRRRRGAADATTRTPGT